MPLPHQVPLNFWFWKFTPKVEPHFILTLSREAELAADSDFPPRSIHGVASSGRAAGVDRSRSKVRLRRRENSKAIVEKRRDIKGRKQQDAEDQENDDRG